MRSGLKTASQNITTHVGDHRLVAKSDIEFMSHEVADIPLTDGFDRFIGEAEGNPFAGPFDDQVRLFAGDRQDNGQTDR